MDYHHRMEDHHPHIGPQIPDIVSLDAALNVLIQCDTPSRILFAWESKHNGTSCMFILWGGRSIKPTPCVPVVVRRPLTWDPGGPSCCGPSRNPLKREPKLFPVRQDGFYNLHVATVWESVSTMFEPRYTLPQYWHLRELYEHFVDFLLHPTSEVSCGAITNAFVNLASPFIERADISVRVLTFCSIAANSAILVNKALTVCSTLVILEVTIHPSSQRVLSLLSESANPRAKGNNTSGSSLKCASEYYRT